METVWFYSASVLLVLAACAACWIVALRRQVAQKNDALGRERAEHKQTEASLREAMDSLDKIFDNSLDSIVVSDSMGRITRVNTSFLDLLGCEREELMGKTPAAFAYYDVGMYDTTAGERVTIDHSFFDTANRTMERLFEEGKVFNWEYYFLRKDGKLVPIEENVTYQHNEAGERIGSVAVIRDITGRKRSEKESVRLSSAIEQVAEAVVLIDTEGVIRYINPATEKMLGFTRGEVVGRNPFRAGSEMYDSIFSQSIWRVISGGQSWTGNMTQRTKDGNTRTIDAAISPVRDDSGNIISYVSIGRDVTGELQMERQVRQGQKMEALGTLAGGIAHDFNNILAAILGFSEMALRDAEESTKLYQNVEQVVKAAHRARTLVDQILDFSHQREQKMKPRKISPLVKETIAFLRATLPSTLEIRHAIDEEGDTVLCEPTQIHQVLMNLCTNAAQSMGDKGGLLEIILDRHSVSPVNRSTYRDLPEGRYVRLLIRDTGPGISPENLERIFDPYFTTKELNEGTGLGLAVVHGIVKRHKGGISVSSTAHQSTVFEVLFPSAEKNDDAPETEAGPTPSGSGRILFVDDEQVLVAMNSDLLESLGYDVTGCTTAEEALRLFKAQPDAYDLIITDKTMPHRSGYDLAKELLQIRSQMPILLSTGFSDADDARRVKELGLKGIVKKPISMCELSDAIKQVLGDSPRE